MRGEFVMVRAFRGEPLIRRIWDADEDGAQIVSDERFKALVAGDESLFAIWFPKGDLFHFNPTVAKAIIQKFQENGEADWEQLTPWTGGPSN